MSTQEVLPLAKKTFDSAMLMAAYILYGKKSSDATQQQASESMYFETKAEPAKLTQWWATMTDRERKAVTDLDLEAVISAIDKIRSTVRVSY